MEGLQSWHRAELVGPNSVLISFGGHSKHLATFRLEAGFQFSMFHPSLWFFRHLAFPVCELFEKEYPTLIITISLLCTNLCSVDGTCVQKDINRHSGKEGVLATLYQFGRVLAESQLGGS